MSRNFLHRLEQKERERQKNTLNLIASENYAWPEVRRALSSIFGDKYAEGTIGKRFYAGCKVVDELEQYTVDLACKLFNAEYANVQPLSGAAANQIAYAAFLNPGDKVLAMSMKSGGHLTHGNKFNICAKIYEFIHYEVDSKTHKIDYNLLKDLAIKHKPKLILAGASAYPEIIDFQTIGKIAKSINAFFMADIAHIAGLVAAKLHPSPLPHADIVTMTTQKTMRGPRGGLILSHKHYATQIERAVMPGIQGGPHENSIMAKAVMLQKALSPEFRQYQQKILKNSKTMADTLKELGHKLITGGTKNHMLIIDVYQDGKSPHSITGKELETKLESIGIITNRNLIPNDTQSPFVTSGIRLGTPALTSRGLTSKMAQDIAIIISQTIKKTSCLQELKKRVKSITTQLSTPW